MAKELFSCKDCKHSTMHLSDKIFTLGGRIGVIDANYKCTKFPEAKTVVEDIVLGSKKVKAKLPYCSIARRHGDCGLDGKYWSPKHKKDLFKMLTKEHHD
jgi:hypothetical protein